MLFRVFEYALSVTCPFPYTSIDGVFVVDASAVASAVMFDSGPCCSGKATRVVAPSLPLQTMFPGPVMLTETKSTVSSS